MSGLSGNDLWVITSEDQAKHDGQFYQLKPIAGFLNGEQAKQFFIQSGLPTAVLGQIWCLADMNADGRMDRFEFSVAMTLIKKRLQGFEVPLVLPPSLRTTAFQPLPGAASSALPRPALPSAFNGTSLNNYSVATLPNAGSAKWAHAPPNSLPYSISPTKSAAAVTADWSIPQATRLKYKQIFNTHDVNHRGYLTGLEAKSVLSHSGLVHTVLAQIWCLADIDTDGNLSPDEFCVAMYLIDLAKSGHPLPAALPPDLIPPAYRRLRRGSETVGGGVVALPPPVSTLHTQPGKTDAFGSLVSDMGMEVGVADPVNQDLELNKAGSLVTFEDRRKENFDKGQVELERRRQMLREQQQREEEERLAHERQEAEKRERIRQEQELKKQQELEKQMEKQRQLEMEREEQRRKAMEQREAARREMDRQRQLEWERQRRELLTTEKLREDALVDRLEQQISQLKLESTACNTKKEDMAGRMETAQGVIREISSSIESMKTAYEHKQRLVEQQQHDYEEWTEKLTISQCERQKLERQSKMSTPFAGDADKMIQNSCATVRASRDRISAQLNELNEKSNQSQSQLDESSAQLLQSRSELELVRAECKRLHELIRQTKQEWERKKSGGVKSSSTEPEKRNGELTGNTSENKSTRTDPFGDVDWMSDAKSSTSTSGFGTVWVGESKPSVSSETASSWPSDTNQHSATNNWASFNNGSSSPAAGGATSFDSFSDQKTSNWAAFTDKGSDPKASLSFSSDSSWPTVTNSDGGGGGVGTRHVALYQFDARSADELSLSAGDIVWVVPDQSNAEPGWMIGRKNDVEGCFPAAYVQPQPLAADTTNNHNVYDTLTLNSNKPLTSSSPRSVGGNGPMSFEQKGETPPPKTLSATNTLNSSPNSTKVSGTDDKRLEAVALYPWKAKRDNHVSFNKGDVITVLEQQDIWWSGSVNGATGWFPKSYVRLQSEATNGRYPEGHVAAPSTPTEPILAPRTSLGSSSSAPGGDSVVWGGAPPSSSPSAEPGDLLFSQGDIITVLKEDGEWWTGTLAGKTGIFPANYVKQFEPSNNSKLSAGKKPEIATVIAAYQGTGVEQLTLQPGQLISVRKKSPSGWWEGELQAKGQKRRVGWFPANYVKLLGSTESPRSTRESSPQMEGPGSTSYPAPTSQPSLEQVVAAYNYDPRQEDELGFVKGSIINVISKLDADWWKGEQNGRVGMFPSNYVTVYTGPSVSNMSPANFSYWNKDWKPGPYPRTAEERAAAAKKYGLRPEDYQPYPDDGLGYGDYPMLPRISNESRSANELWDIPELKRNYGEPMHVDADILTEDRWNPTTRKRYSYTQMLLWLGAVWGSIIGLYILFLPYPWFPKAMPKQYPIDGKKHYTFEPLD